MLTQREVDAGVRACVRAGLMDETEDGCGITALGVQAVEAMAEEQARYH